MSLIGVHELSSLQRLRLFPDKCPVIDLEGHLYWAWQKKSYSDAFYFLVEQIFCFAEQPRTEIVNQLWRENYNYKGQSSLSLF